VRRLKASITASAGIAVVAAGLFVMAPPAQGIYCKRSFIPWGYYPTGAPCGLGCDGEIYQNDNGRQMCVIYGPSI
jgi:hypothetical protein